MWPFKKKRNAKKLKFETGDTVICLRTQWDCEIKGVSPDSGRPYYVNDLRGTGFYDEEYCLAAYSPDLKVYEIFYTSPDGGKYSVCFGGSTDAEAMENFAQQMLARGYTLAEAITACATPKRLNISRMTMRKMGAPDGGQTAGGPT